LVLAGTPALADLRELVGEATLQQISAETSGEAAKRNLDTITLQHRMRSGDQFDAATQFIRSRLEDYGLDAVETLRYAADGKTMFGTQKSRPVWAVRFAELWELERVDGGARRVRRLGDWDAVPLTLAQDSLSADVTTTLVDVGSGTAEADYRGKDVAGKLVLTSSQPGAIVDLAVGEKGAAGIISYAPNQRSAWWKEDDRLVRWGHIGSFPKTKSFGFMISLGEARKLQQRLAAGEEILFHARVEAGHEKGYYEFVTAEIEGTDKKDEIIHYTCHLDHPRPGANDNVSGCVAILETARTLNALIRNENLPRPRRTLKFLWPAEIEGSIMYLAGLDDPSRIKANVHMDMVGGAPVTKAVFRISGGPYVPTECAGRRQRAPARADGRARHGQRPRRVLRGHLAYPRAVSARLAGSLHSYEFRHGRQYRSDQAQASSVHRRGERLVSGQPVRGRRSGIAGTPAPECPDARR
jgi:hypothetical protein